MNIFFIDAVYQAAYLRHKQKRRLEVSQGAAFFVALMTYLVDAGVFTGALAGVAGALAGKSFGVICGTEFTLRTSPISRLTVVFKKSRGLPTKFT